MAALKNIAQDFRQSSNDLYINYTKGDFDVTASDNQHIEDIIESEQGWWKEFPSVGAAARKLLKGKFSVQNVESVIKQQLEADGFQVYRPKISIDSNGNGTIQPFATRITF